MANREINDLVVESAKMNLKSVEFLHKDISENTGILIRNLVALRKYIYALSFNSIPLALITGTISGLVVSHFTNIYLGIAMLIVCSLALVFTTRNSNKFESELRELEKELLEKYEKHINNLGK